MKTVNLYTYYWFQSWVLSIIISTFIHVHMLASSNEYKCSHRSKDVVQTSSIPKPFRELVNLTPFNLGDCFDGERSFCDGLEVGSPT